MLLGEPSIGPILEAKPNRRTLETRGCPPKTPKRRLFSPEEDVDYKERRRGPRYPFIASAELIEQKADVRIASRVSELSMNGCYLDMMNPFPQGTMVLVKISAGEDFFQSKGKVVYSQMNMGAGVGFQEFDQASRAVLERWMDEAKKEALKNA
ncbi:MAG TPA: PilZ domain-containing protein [Candidatus Acidoferrum sp.]|nr:PilZ domain-containing protein [Candidatus Acidoferrum sp.]